MSFWKKPPSPARIEEFGRSAGAASIPHLAHFLSWTYKASTVSALAVIDRELRKLRPSDLRSLDREVRRHRHWPPWFPMMKPRHVGKIVSRFGYPLAAAAMTSMHPSGYVREQAVRGLGRIRTGEELPHLLVRASDWVEPVRRAALKGVEERLTRVYLPIFVRNLGILDGGTRVSDRVSPLDEKVERLLNSTDTTEWFAEAVVHPDRLVRRAAARWALRSRADALVLCEHALRQDDVVAAELIARRALELMTEGRTAGAATAPLAGLLQKLANHPQGSLRRMGLIARLEHFPGSSSEVLNRVLFDRHAGVRDVARSEASKKGIDVAERYRKALSADPYIALLGLGETGGAEDALLAVPYLTSARTKIRRAAVVAIASLDAGGRRDTLLDALVDESPAVSRAAARALREVGAPAGDLQAIFRSTPHEHVRENVGRLLARGERWTALEIGLSALIASRPDLSEAGERLIAACLQRWNRSGTQPPPGTIERLLPLWLEARPRLSHVQADEIDFTLRSFHRGPATALDG